MLLAVAVGALIMAGLMAPAVQAAPPTGTVVTTSTANYGRALVVGSGPYAGYSLYFITSDHGHHFGCTTLVVSTVVGPLLCTGPSDDSSAEWPAITTVGDPVAAGGVHQWLLGTVYRPGIGRQITYAGHPLYLFDPTAGTALGEGWDEPTLPPWGGVWWLIQPSGLALPWQSQLTTTVLAGGETVLATTMETALGPENFPVYGYSEDSRHDSDCTDDYCAHRFPALLSNGPATVSGIDPKISTIWTEQGPQVEYDGHPLYLDGQEGINFDPTTGAVSTDGNGDGAHVEDGHFFLIPVSAQI